MKVINSNNFHLCFYLYIFLENIPTEEKIMNSPIKFMFGRPNFPELFRAFIQKDSKEFHVYSTTSPGVNNSIFEATQLVMKETKVKFHHIYEATS